MRALKYLFVVAAVVLACGHGVAAADDPVSAPPPFPFAELAAEAAAVAPVWFRVRADAALRLRPGLTWPVAAELGAGDVARASAVTPGGEPWLRIGAGPVPRGWMRAADAGLHESVLERLPVAVAAPIRAELVGWAAEFASWPGGPGGSFKLLRRPMGYPVVGRSADAAWIALRLRDVAPSDAWVRAEAVRLWADDLADLAVVDLPIFIGRGTAVLSLREDEADAVVLLPPADDWRWTAGNTLVGIGEQTVWRYVPALGDLETHARPHGRVKIAPDGRHIVVWVCAAPDPNCDGKDQAYDVVIVPTDGGAWSNVLRAVRPRRPKTGYLDYVGHWSPDSRMLLVGQERHDDSLEQWPWSRWYFSVVMLNGAHSSLPQVEGTPRCSWRWLPDGSLINCAGARYSAEPHVTLLQANAAPPGGWWYVAGQRSLLGYVPMGSRLPGGLADGGWSMFDLDTGAVRPLSELEGLSRVVTSAQSADGRWAALLAERDAEPRVVVFDRTTGDVTVTAALELPGYRRSASPMVLAPTGDRLLWEPDPGRTTNGSVYVVELRTGRATELVLIPESEYGPVCGRARNWSPDGEQFTLEVFEVSEWAADGTYGRDGLAAVLDHQRTTQIRVYDRSGGFVRAFRALSRGLDASLREVVWSPDGRWLALVDTSLPESYCRAGA